MAKRRLRSSFLSADANEMHRMLALRNRLRGLRLARLRSAFTAWRSTGHGFEDLFRSMDLTSPLHNRLPHRADLKRLLRPKKYRKAGPAPLLQLWDADGTLCQTHTEITECWRDHFAKLEGGSPTVRPTVPAAELVDWRDLTGFQHDLGCFPPGQSVQSFRSGLHPALCLQEVRLSAFRALLADSLEVMVVRLRAGRIERGCLVSYRQARRPGQVVVPIPPRHPLSVYFREGASQKHA